MDALSYHGKRWKNGEVNNVDDAMAVEVPLEIQLDNFPFSTTMCSPGDLEALVRGLLHTEDLYRGVLTDLHVSINKKDNTHLYIAKVHAKTPWNKPFKGTRQLLSVTSCGICGNQHFDKKKGASLKGKKFDATKISTMFNDMNAAQSQFLNTGGSHAASIFNSNSELLSIGQDIGRHNATDKAIGKLLMNGKLKEGSYLLVSGRLSYEIMAKAFSAGIPNVCSVSAPSSLAIDVAKEWGMNLLGFCRNDRFTLYASD